MPHNINKDTVYINTPVELYLQEKQRRQKVCGGREITEAKIMWKRELLAAYVEVG